MACTSLVAGGAKPVAASEGGERSVSPVVVNKPAERKGLSRFYKSKSQSFRCLSESLKTEFGDSARGLSKRVKFWHQGEASECVATCPSVATTATLSRSRQVEWIQRCTAHACAELVGLRVTDKESWSPPQKDAAPRFLIGLNPGSRKPVAARNRVRRAAKGAGEPEAESVRVTRT